ncbi:MAG: hypothetical protein FWD53_05485 [Phycisphaerales bacterium]|nr:hypothetical protein [Phycisphaerales bacterium]
MRNPDQKILDDFAQLRNVTPPPDSTRRAIGRAREKILSVYKPPSHRFFWRIIVPTSIAASIVAALTVLAVLLTGTTVSAADALNTIAAENRKYQGWIHVRMEKIPESMQNTGPSIYGMKRATGASFHFNTANGTSVKIIELGADRIIEWKEPHTGLYQSYNSADKQLAVSNSPPENTMEQFRQKLKDKHEFTPWQLAEFLLVEPTMDGIMALVDYGCEVTQQKDGQYDRFDLSLKNPKDANAKTEPFLTIKFDHKTKLIQHWSGTFDRGTIAFVFTYGRPEFKNIHDAGVPANTKIAKRGETITSDAKAILARLDARVGPNEKLGDYVAIKTETRTGQNKDGKQVERKGLVIYGRNGEKRLFARYWDLDKQPFDPEGWPPPPPTGMKLVNSAKNILPEILFIYDGTQGWFYRKDFGSPNPGFKTLKPEEATKDFLPSFSLSGSIWPGRHSIDFHHLPRLGIDIQTLNDPNRPDQVGIRVIESGWASIMPGTDFDRIDYEWQLNTKRDDLPVERTTTYRTADGKNVSQDLHQYSDFAQLPTSQWYPTRWLSTYTVGTKTLATDQHHLIILPNDQLPPDWFTDPTNRFIQPNR